MGLGGLDPLIVDIPALVEAREVGHVLHPRYAMEGEVGTGGGERRTTNGRDGRVGVFN
jgi:hypothetical protein